jgi:hypothetical protein
MAAGVSLLMYSCSWGSAWKLYWKSAAMGTRAPYPVRCHGGVKTTAAVKVPLAGDWQGAVLGLAAGTVMRMTHDQTQLFDETPGARGHAR